MKQDRISNYHIARTLGVGVSGEVVLGTNCHTNERVAIKYFYNEHDVEVEVQAYRSFPPCSNILQMIEYDMSPEDGTNPYIVLELANQDLFSFIENRKRVSKSLVNHLSKGILNGLKTMHTAGIAHCDIKLDNLFLDQDLNLSLIHI